MDEVAVTVDYHAEVERRERKAAVELEKQGEFFHENFWVQYAHDGLVLGNYDKSYNNYHMNGYLWLGDGFKVSKRSRHAELWSPVAFVGSGALATVVWVMTNFGHSVEGDPHFLQSIFVSFIMLAIAIGSAVTLCFDFENNYTWNRWSKAWKPLSGPTESAIQLTEAAQVGLINLLNSNKNKRAITSAVKRKVSIVETDEEMSAWLLMLVEIFDIMPSFPVDSILMSNRNMCEVLNSLRVQEAKIALEKAAADKLEAEALRCGKDTLNQLTRDGESHAKEEALSLIETFPAEMFEQS